MIRQLTEQEMDMVTGGWGEVGPGNPGNFKPVGKSGETPSDNSNFITGGTTVPVANGRAGNSAG